MKNLKSFDTFINEGKYQSVRYELNDTEAKKINSIFDKLESNKRI